MSIGTKASLQEHTTSDPSSSTAMTWWVVTSNSQELTGESELRASKTPPGRSLERRVDHGVKRVQLDQQQDPIGQDLPLHLPDIDFPLLVLSSQDAEDVLEDINKSIPIYLKEDELVDPLDVTPPKSVKNLIGRPPSLGL